MKEEKALKAAKKIKKYCAVRVCNGCVFERNGNYLFERCALYRNVPAKWEVQSDENSTR